MICGRPEKFPLPPATQIRFADAERRSGSHRRSVPRHRDVSAAETRGRPPVQIVPCNQCRRRVTLITIVPANLTTPLKSSKLAPRFVPSHGAVYNTFGRSTAYWSYGRPAPFRRHQQRAKSHPRRRPRLRNWSENGNDSRESLLSSKEAKVTPLNRGCEKTMVGSCRMTAHTGQPSGESRLKLSDPFGSPDAYR
jgi:hypothetical protein